MNRSFADLRFSDGTNKLHYWIVPDSIIEGSSCKVYVKLASNSTKIYEHWGNPNAASENDIKNTMEFGDEFNGASLDTGSWTGTAALSNGIATIAAPNSISSITKFGRGYETIARTRINLVGTSSGAAGFYDGKNAVLLNAYSGVPHFQLYTMTNGYANGVDVSSSLNGNWHDVRVSYNPTAEMVFDSTTVSTSIRVPNVALPATVVSASAGSVDIDYLAVRKYSNINCLKT
jgi:hypothetical protein